MLNRIFIREYLVPKNAMHDLGNEIELDQLRHLAIHLKGDFEENFKCAQLKFDNENGSGHIATYIVLPGLMAKVYNVNLNRELRLSEKNAENSPVLFCYCVKGHFYHRFQDETVFEKITHNQNLILSGNGHCGHDIILPKAVSLEITMLFLDRKRIEQSKGTIRTRLEYALSNDMKEFGNTCEKKFFGEISPMTAEHASILTNNMRLDGLGVLITEGAILNTLASQVDNYRKNAGSQFHSPLTGSELNRIASMGEYIQKNLERKISVGELQRICGMNPKKLQEGFRYLYGESVNSFIRRLRLERARQLLQNTDLSISEVSFRLGITSRSYFSKIFYDYFGMLPSRFQESLSNGDFIFELSYRSKISDGTSHKEIRKIVDISVSNNGNMDITGALVFYQGIFFQIIEGPKKHVMDLYKKLLGDDRHYDVQLIWKGAKTKRTFGDWSMAYLSGDMPGSSGANLTHVDLKPIMEEMQHHEIFSDILWRRVLNILKTPA